MGIIRPEELGIDAEDPFREDCLDRRRYAEALTRLLVASKSPFVLAIDSAWGTGKSTFLQMWKPLLDCGGFHTILLNAWKTDFFDEPLVPLLGELDRSFLALGKKGQAIMAAKEKAKEIQKIGAKLVPVLTNAAIRWALHTSEDIEKLLADCTEKLVQEKIEHYASEISLIEKFRSSVAELATALPSGNERPGTQIVIMVDELDRCRPPYAILMLERIKHLFDVPGVVFVLALDRDQLAEAIRPTYGNGFDADGYLRRFFDLDFRLPNPNIRKYCDAQFTRLGFAAKFDRRQREEEASQSVDMLERVGAFFDLSLREMNQLCARFGLLLDTSPPDEPIYAPLSVFLIGLRMKESETYDEIVQRRARLVDLLLTRPEASSLLADHNGKLLRIFGDTAFASREDRDEVLKQYINADDGIACDIIGRLYNKPGFGFGAELVRRIELLHHFHFE